MKVVLNGEEREVVSTDVHSLLDELSFAGKKVAVELNKTIVSRESYSTTMFEEGAQIEIVHFIGGG